MRAKGRRKANYWILRKVLYYNALEFFTQKASLPQWNESSKSTLTTTKKSAAEAGFCTTCLHVRLRNLRSGYMFFATKKGVFPTTDPSGLWE